jgi:CubicO group peptidase (beta-lactamase class C family)
MMRMAAFLALTLAACAAPDGREITHPVSRENLFGIRQMPGSFTAMDRIFLARRVAAAATPRPLPRAEAPFPPVTFMTGDGHTTSLDAWLETSSTSAFLVMRKDGTILLERYLQERRPTDRFTSWSMGKTVIGMLTGIAVAEGAIRSLDDPAGAYVPGLAGTAYAEVPIRDLLHMTSGVLFREEYMVRVRGSDPQQLAQGTFHGIGPGGPAALSFLRQRAAPPGQVFNYASADTQALGLVLTAATGQSIAAYLEQRIWQPMGAEAEASWLVDRAGQEAAFCCLNATLRDYGRLAMLLANGGRVGTQQVLPEAWARDMLQVRGGVSPFYAYQIWRTPAMSGALFRGVHGQWIAIRQFDDLIIVRLATETEAGGGLRVDNTAENILSAVSIALRRAGP